VDVLFLVGRILFALVFLFSGSTVHLLQARQGIEYARMNRVPAPELLVPLSGLVAVLGALSVILGIWADLGSLLLVAFLLPVAFFMHAFWRETDEQTKANQMAHFMKNMAIAGGALVLFYAYNQLQAKQDCRSPIRCSAAADDEAMPEAIDHDEVRRLIAEESAQLVEVLPAKEYGEEHIAGAINIPLKELDDRAPREVDRDRPVIVYCNDYQ
jgi:putative oxidoreductase